MKQKITIILFILVFAGCKKEYLIENPDNINLLDFEMVWKKYNEVYPFFEYKGIKWDSIYKVYQPLASKAKGD